MGVGDDRACGLDELSMPEHIDQRCGRHGGEADKRRLAPLYRRAVLPTEFAGRSPEWAGARLLQHLLARHPELTDTLLTADEALFAFGESAQRLAIPAGETVVRFRAWQARPLTDALAREPDLFPPAPLPEGFAPGVFARATWQLATAASPREAAQLASAWLSEQRLPHTLRRDGDAWRADLAPAAAKKKCVFSLCAAPCGSPASPPSPTSSESRVLPGAGTLLSPPAAGSTLTVAFSPKADLRALLARLPPHPGQPRAASADILF
jgi:hypothetical protein